MDEFDREVIAEDSFVLAGPLGHPLMRPRRPAQLGELEGKSVLLLEDGHCFRDQAFAICATANAREASFRATSLSTLAQMVVGGAGVTLLPALSLEVENRRGELAVRRFACPVPSRTLVFAWRKQSSLGSGLREIARAIRGCLPAGTGVAVAGKAREKFEYARSRSPEPPVRATAISSVIIKEWK